MYSGWMEKCRAGTERAKHRPYSACIRALRYNRRYLACVCPVYTVSFISSAIRHLLRASASSVFFAYYPPSPISLSPSLFHARYVRNLAVANSCTNVNAGRDGFTNCFSLPPPTADPFYSAISPFFLLPSFSSSRSVLLLSLASVYVAMSRIAEIPHLFSFSGAVVGRAGRIARTRETAEGKNAER